MSTSRAFTVLKEANTILAKRRKTWAIYGGLIGIYEYHSFTAKENRPLWASLASVGICATTAFYIPLAVPFSLPLILYTTHLNYKDNPKGYEISIYAGKSKDKPKDDRYDVNTISKYFNYINKKIINDTQYINKDYGVDKDYSIQYK